MASGFLCSFRSFMKRREDKLTPEAKQKVADRLVSLAEQWESPKSGKYKNVKDANWNNFDTFEWLWNKYTMKEYDPEQNPFNLKDIRKFEFGLDYYNNLIAKKDGPIWGRLHLPRAAMQNIPELKRFETNLIKESSFYRDYNTSSSRQINEFLETFKELGLSLGESKLASLPGVRSLTSASQREVRSIQKEYEALVEGRDAATNDMERAKYAVKFKENRAAFERVLTAGSGRAFSILNSVLQGADIETVTYIDRANPNVDIKLNAAQKNHLYKIIGNYNMIRQEGVVGMIRGLQKIKQIARSKDLGWVDGTVERINGLIKNIEFQHRIDQEGKTIDYKHMVDERNFLELGFRAENPTERFSAKDRKLGFSPHYMAKYTLGLLKQIKSLEKNVEDGKLSIDKQLEIELNDWDGIIDRAKGRSDIIDPRYDGDPYFFLKRYASDIGTFNYKAHVKANFKDAVDTITNEHLKPAREARREDLEESAMAMIHLMRDVNNEIQLKDPTQDGYLNDMMRLMTSVTYFRLMGGNIRSAVRNGTQRVYELVHFGFKAAAPMVGDAAKWYKDTGAAESNVTKVTRQLKKFGLQWYDGKSRTSNAWDAFKGDKDVNVSEQSRGALEEAHALDRNLYVDQNGDLRIREGERITEKAAAATSYVSKKAGFMHKIVEDWNRNRTFKVGFALAHGNLMQSDKGWLARKVLVNDIDAIKASKGQDYSVNYKDVIEKFGSAHEKKVADWIENAAGQMAYNATLDLHFEYSKWAKAQAIRIRGTESGPVQFAKAGLGQFSHYRFNMMNLMWNWAKEGGISMRAGDFTSQEAFRMMRFGVLQSMLLGATVAGRVNLIKLMPNDVLETGDAMFAWLTANKEKIESGEVTKETQEWLDEATHGAGGKYFLGPNYPILDKILSISELAGHLESNDPRANLGGNRSVWSGEAFDRSVDIAVNKGENQEKYERLHTYNSQAARFLAYTKPMFTGGGGIMDAVSLELGLFPSKTQRAWSDWLYGKKRKGGKKVIRKNMSASERENILFALSKIPRN